MSLASVLVKSFQVWLKSPVARQAMVQAEKTLAPQLAKVGATIAGDTLAISSKAAAQVATKAAARTWLKTPGESPTLTPFAAAPQPRVRRSGMVDLPAGRQGGSPFENGTMCML